MLDGAPIEPLLLFLLALQSFPCTFPVYHGQPAQTGLMSGYNGGSSQTLGLVSDSFCPAARVKVQVCDTVSWRKPYIDREGNLFILQGDM